MSQGAVGVRGGKRERACHLPKGRGEEGERATSPKVALVLYVCTRAMFLTTLLSFFMLRSVFTPAFLVVAATLFADTEVLARYESARRGGSWGVTV